MDENKLIDAVVRAISDLEDSLKADVSTIKADVNSLKEGVSTLRSDMNRNNERMIQTFDTFGNAIIDKLTELTTETKGMREDLKTYSDHEERIKKLEEIVYKKGA